MTLFEAVAKFTMDTSGFTSAVKAVQSGFSGINQMAGNAKSGISAFGDVLKANLVSEAITKGLEAITNGFKSVTSMADNFIKSSVSAGMSFDSAMSQVYATMGEKSTRDYNKVIEYCQKVENEGYSLVDNFDDLWTVTNKFSSERT